jgi:hypothetical protein
MRKPDELAFFAAARAAAARSATGTCPGRVALQRAAEGLGMHPNRANDLLRKWDQKGWWNYGVTLWAGWFEPEAPQVLEP